MASGAAAWSQEGAPPATAGGAGAEAAPSPSTSTQGEPALGPPTPGPTQTEKELADGDVVERAFALERLKCHLANAPADITAMFNMMIKPNQNPTLASVTLDPMGTPTTLFELKPTAAPAIPIVAPGAAVTLEAAWTDTTPESYPVFNVVTQVIDTHREPLSVSWFATDGSFEHDRTGRGEDETELTTDNVWTAPMTPGVVHFWSLLRDIRGGVDFAEGAAMVGP